MQMKLKSGKTLELTEEQMNEIKHLMTNYTFDKMDQYFHWMEDKARSNLQMIADEDIDSEKDLKQSLSNVLKFGSYEDVSDFIIESIEWFISYHILNSAKDK